jgi:hypothetical protein
VIHHIDMLVVMQFKSIYHSRPTLFKVRNY